MVAKYIIQYWTVRSSEPNTLTAQDVTEFRKHVDDLKADVDVTKIATYLAHTVEERISSFKTIL